MTNRAVNLLYLLAFILVIGAMSWRDMNPHESTYKPLPAYPYYAGDNITSPDMVPADMMPLTIGQGTFSYTADGKTSWVPAGLPLSTFAQRQLALQFRFKNIPHTPAQTKETLDKIASLIDAWERQGNTIVTIFLEYTAEKPELKNYISFYKTALERFHLHYTLISTIVPAWGEGPEKELYTQLVQDSGQLLFIVPTDWNTPAAHAQMARIKYNTLFQLPPGIAASDVNEAMTKQLTSSTLILTLDPHKPTIQKTDKVGLFPKF